VPLDHAAALNLPPFDPCGRFCFVNFLSRIWGPTVSFYAILPDMIFIDSVADQFSFSGSRWRFTASFGIKAANGSKTEPKPPHPVTLITYPTNPPQTSPPPREAKPNQTTCLLTHILKRFQTKLPCKQRFFLEDMDVGGRSGQR